MTLEEFVIDVQLYQDETKEPTEESVTVLPAQNITTKKNQLQLKWSNRKMKLSRSVIIKTVDLFLTQWKQTFSLYPIERVFIDYAAHERIELLITFDANRLYSNTQIRNIKANAPELLKKALNKAYAQYGLIEATPTSTVSSSSTMDYDRFDTTSSAVTEAMTFVASENISSNENSLVVGKDAINTNQKILDLDQQILEKSQVIQSYEKNIKSVQREYETKIEQVLQENDKLKQKILSYQDKEIDYRQQLQLSQSEIFTLKNNVSELNVSLEQDRGLWKRRLQSLQTENDDLRRVIIENQQFEEQVQNSLRKATDSLQEKEELLAQIQQENELTVKEWELKLQQVSDDKERLNTQHERLNELLAERQEMIQQLTDELGQKERDLSKLIFDHQQATQEFQHQLALKDEELTGLDQSKNEEIQRLSDRLEKQQKLVDQLMTSQESTQNKWQDNYNRLEKNYRAAASKVFDLEQELSKLRQVSVTASAMTEPVFPNLPVDDELNFNDELISMPQLDSFDLDIEASVGSEPVVDEIEIEDNLDKSYQYTDDDYEYGYQYDGEYSYSYDDEDDDYDEDYDYDYDSDDYDEDYDYDYEDYDEDYDYEDEYDDDVLGYDEETIMEDVDSILEDTEDEEGKEKIRKKEFSAFESQLDELSDRWKELDDQDVKFKKWAAPLMKKFDRFYRKLDDNVKEPSLFSRKYVTTEEVWGQIQAYALISRHIETLLNYED